MTTGAPRIDPAAAGFLVQRFARLAGRVQRTEPPGVFLTLGRQRRLFWSWLVFAGALMPGGRLPRRESELLILRVASTSGSDYELNQHRRLGRRAGLTREEIERVQQPGVEGWSARDAVLLEAADELLATQDLGDPTWARLRGELDEPTCVELVLLVGHYRMLATALTALRVPVDRDRARDADRGA